MADTDLYDTLVNAARWSRIAGLVAHSGHQVLFDDYEAKQGRNDFDFISASTENSIKFLLDLYDFVADEPKRKKLRKLFREIIARSMRWPPLSEIVWPLKQRVDEYDFLAKHNCHPPDGGTDA